MRMPRQLTNKAGEPSKVPSSAISSRPSLALFNVREHWSTTPEASETRKAMLDRIEARLGIAGWTLSQAIEATALYFRVSLLGGCNLTCPFCHNEGAPTIGRLEINDFAAACAGAADVGFVRLQLTGGEPLLRDDVVRFVDVGRRHFEDVGITTNGTLLERRWGELRDSGITRIHLSLQRELLEDAGSAACWGIPVWLAQIIEDADRCGINMRVNLPVPDDSLPIAEAFLKVMRSVRCDLKAFAVLPEGDARQRQYPLQALAAIVVREVSDREELGVPSAVTLRSFVEPRGVRCDSCTDRNRCTEQSRSLRLGSDRILRPCLATRAWDSVCPLEVPEQVGPAIREAALFAIDFVQW